MVQLLRILLVGKGGREHALAWKLSHSQRVDHVFVVPGNGGTESGLEKVSNVTGTAANDYPALVQLAKKLDINLVVVGPDDAVVDGIEGYFREVGIPCFSPSKDAAALEGSKTFAKDFMKEHKIPTAAFENFDDFEKARQYVSSGKVSMPIVVKASGLAAGKGVIICQTEEEAIDALKSIMVDRGFGAAGSSVVIEEFLEGNEISVLTFSDGKIFKSLPPGQDHKRIYEQDQGPNTGGMGVYAPVPMATDQVMAEIEERILKPTFAGLQERGMEFKGLLFTGIMLTPQGPKVLEFNVRFGDPETQSLLPLLTSNTDLAEILLACTQGRLHEVQIKVQDSSACNVIVAASGYPGSYAQGSPINLGPLPSNTIVFHAGTKIVDDRLVTAGGRVLAVVGIADTLENAVSKAYEGVKSVHFEGMYYRKDIAHRALSKHSSRG